MRINNKKPRKKSKLQTNKNYKCTLYLQCIYNNINDWNDWITSYGEMIFHCNFLASGGNSVQNIISKTMPIQKNALKIN